MAKYYNNIVDLPLRNFIEAKVDNNLAALIIEGLPTQAELNDAWYDIQTEYADAIGDLEQTIYLELLKDVTLLSVDYEKLQMIIPFLIKIPFNVLDPAALAITEEYIKTFTDDINKILKTNCPFDPSDHAKYVKDLESSLRKSKSLKMRYDIKLAELEAIKSNQADGHPVTKEYFYSILNTLEDHSKIKIDDTISVYRFCDRIRKYNKYCTEKNKK